MLPVLLTTLWLALVPEAAICSATPEYYKIDLIPTRRVPAARQAQGAAHLTFEESPFGIALSPKGVYRYNLEVKVSQLRQVPDRVYTAWIATPDLNEVKRLGPLSEDGRVQGRVAWNKFLVFITLEPVEGGERQGPVVMRGLSRSGLMHTMAGHGPFQQEPCAVYGYY